MLFFKKKNQRISQIIKKSWKNVPDQQEKKKKKKENTSLVMLAITLPHTYHNRTYLITLSFC